MEDGQMREESIYEELRRYAQSDAYPFHMPGHKRKVDWISNAYEIDITEIDGFDDLHHAEGMLKEGMERMAKAVKAKQSYYIVNGSTCAILAALYGSCPEGGKIAAARNTHKSVAHAILLRKLNPVYIYPQNVDNMCISGEIIHNDIETAYEKHPDICAVVVTSPTYEGIVSDIPKISQAVHAHGGILIVDEAHGAHLAYAQTEDETGMKRRFLPDSAVHGGADLVIQSLHKTLPCLTQSAALHICSDRVNTKKIERALHIFETSSPSYVLMAGMDLCVRYMETEGKKKLQELCERLGRFYEKAKCWGKLWFLYPEMKRKDEVENKKAENVDYTKIVFGARNLAGSGRGLHQVLRERYHLQPEMSAPDYVILMTMLTDTEEGFSRLEAALEEINNDLENGIIPWESASKEETRKRNAGSPVSSPVFVPLVQAMRPCEAAEADTVSVKINEAAGRISAETAYVYPPGCPFLMPGERISEELTDLIHHYKENAMELYGMEDETGERILVVQNA